MSKPSKMEIWKHNSFFGGTSMTKSNMQRILLSETATKESKDLARQIYALATVLYTSLKTREDQRNG